MIASHNNKAQWLVGLREDQSNPPIWKGLKYEELDSTRPWHDPSLLDKEAICTPWVPGGTNELAAKEGTNPEWLDSHDPEGSQKECSPILLLPDNLPLHNRKLLSGIIAVKMSRHMA